MEINSNIFNPEILTLQFLLCILFDSWSQASVVVDFKSLCELILLEEFKNCFPEQTVMYLSMQKVATLQEAAVLAEEFALTHKAVEQIE